MKSRILYLLFRFVCRIEIVRGGLEFINSLFLLLDKEAWRDEEGAEQV